MASLVRPPRFTWMIGPTNGTSLLTVAATPATSESKSTGQPNVVSEMAGSSGFGHELRSRFGFQDFHIGLALDGMMAELR